MLNEVFGNVELSEGRNADANLACKTGRKILWANVVSAIRKAMTSDASGGNCSPRL